MMNIKRAPVIVIVVLIAAVLSAVFFVSGRKNGVKKGVTIVHPAIEDIDLAVTTTGVVEPQNRLEIKPSIGGRIEEILVREGDKVNVGEILAWMSSTERAALVDAARSQGPEALKYWEDVYKKTPIISPIDGEVIVRSIEPGQTVTTSDPILVLSDRLVVNGQFDETDIGMIKVGQKASISLDAYPDVVLEGIVDHIAYESKIVNNVTVYEADIVPDKIPAILRSGMSVTVDVIVKTAAGVVTIPSSAIHRDGKRKFVLVETGNGRVEERDIAVGLNNDKEAEVTRGLTVNDSVIINDGTYLPKKKSVGTNPFMPSRKK
ncbi:MAG: efflux RND transporter periplasmic adaptor subunit [Candidatus Omnitrophota bacterium]